MPPECPQCLSTRTHQRHLGKKVGAVLGTIVGAVIGAASPAVSAGTHQRIYALIRMGGLIASGAPDALTGALAAGSAGCAIGSATGEVIDIEVLDSHLCLSCGNTFRPSRFERSMWDAN